MTLHPLPSELGLGGGAGLHDHEVRQLNDVIAELQRLRTTVVDGAAANTAIPVAGLAAGDTLQSVIEYAAGVPADRTVDSTVNTDGELEVDANTTGNKLVVTWWGHQA